MKSVLKYLISVALALPHLLSAETPSNQSCLSCTDSDVSALLGTSNYSFMSSSSQFATPGENATEVTELNGEDDGSHRIDLPFAFGFFGTSYSQTYISTNGVLSFGKDFYDTTNVQLPNKIIYPALLAVYWDDLLLDANARVMTEVLGTFPERRFVITWRDLSEYQDETNEVDSDVTFQAVLFEGSNIIGLSYPDLYFEGTPDISNGASATVGLQNNLGDGLTYSLNTAGSIPDGTTLYALPPGYSGSLPSFVPPVTPTNTPTPTSTATHTAIPTITPTLEPTHIPTVTPTPTLVSTPTLAELLLLDLEQALALVPSARKFPKTGKSAAVKAFNAGILAARTVLKNLVIKINSELAILEPQASLPNLTVTNGKKLQFMLKQASSKKTPQVQAKKLWSKILKLIIAMKQS